MTNEPFHQTGVCMCGAVRFGTTADPARVIHCHCEDCRRHTGAPMATLPVYSADQVVFSGQARRLYRSSENAQRAFCPTCGTSITFEADLRGYGSVCALHISAFDDPETLRPTHHSYFAERISWMDLADDLPRYKRLVVDGELMHRGPATDAD